MGLQYTTGKKEKDVQHQSAFDGQDIPQVIGHKKKGILCAGELDILCITDLIQEKNACCPYCKTTFSTEMRMIANKYSQDKRLVSSKNENIDLLGGRGKGDWLEKVKEDIKGQITLASNPSNFERHLTPAQRLLNQQQQNRILQAIASAYKKDREQALKNLEEEQAIPILRHMWREAI